MTTLDFNFFYCDYASEKKKLLSQIRLLPKKLNMGLERKKNLFYICNYIAPLIINTSHFRAGQELWTHFDNLDQLPMKTAASSDDFSFFI